MRRECSEEINNRREDCMGTKKQQYRKVWRDTKGCLKTKSNTNINKQETNILKKDIYF